MCVCVCVCLFVCVCVCVCVGSPDAQLCCNVLMGIPKLFWLLTNLWYYICTDLLCRTYSSSLIILVSSPDLTPMYSG